MASGDLRGRTALVTGGAKRIGRVICLRLAEEGVNVVFTYRKSATEASRTEDELRQRGVEALALEADLSDLNACRAVIQQATAEVGKVDVLVNNASDFARSDLEELNRDPHKFEGQFAYLTRLHMGAPFYLAMSLGLLMKQQGWGRIINITDRVAAKGQAYRGWSLYLATKYGLYGVTQAMAVELSPEVTVNSIAPGLVLAPTEIDEKQLEKLRDKIPLKKEAGPEAIAEDVLYLIQSDSKTGAVILTDGGSSVQTF
jgi:pteridine reductase